jgi:hypothetical protein
MGRKGKERRLSENSWEGSRRVDSRLAYWSIQLIEINSSGYFQQLAVSPAPASRQFYQSMMPDVEVFDLIQFESWKG